MSLSFEVGKTYRTRNGNSMTVIHRTNAGFAARSGSFPDCTQILYQPNGAPEGTGWDEWTLLPGIDGIDACDDARAIPHRRLDEPAVDPICVLQGQIDRLLWETKQAHARLDALFADRQQQYDALEARCTDLGYKADGAHTRIRALQSAFESTMPAHVTADHENRIAALELGLELMHRHGYPAPNPPKPTIKGGWVNVYRGDYGWPAISAMHPTREDADTWDSGDKRVRIACIQIPDFTEGEGL